MPREIIDTKIAAQRLNYSHKYFQNNWVRLIPGLRPVFLPGGRKILFYWDDIEKLLLQPK